MAAMSRASTSGVRRAKAFLEPSGLELVSMQTYRVLVSNGRLPDEGVDLDGVNVVELLEGKLDLGLVGLDIDDEDQGVLLLNLLQGTLGIERVDDDLVLVEAGSMGDRLARVLGGARELEGLGEVEGGRGADLGLLLGVDLRSRGNVSSAAFALSPRHRKKLTPLRAAWAAFLAWAPLGALEAPPVGERCLSKAFA